MSVGNAPRMPDTMHVDAANATVDEQPVPPVVQVPAAKNINSPIQAAVVLNQVVDDSAVEHGSRPTRNLSGAAMDFLASGGLSGHLPASTVNPHSAKVPRKVVFQYLYSSLFPSWQSFSFHNVNRISVNPDTMIRRYFVDSDLLWHLAEVLLDPTPALDSPPVVLEQSSEVEILDKMPSSNAP